MSVRTSTKTHLQLDSALQLDKVVHEIDDFDLAGFVSVAENFHAGMSQLHRDSADAAGCSVNQDPVTSFEPSMVEEALPGGQS